VFFANTYALDMRPKWEMEALTLHEAVPGHHLQMALAQEIADMPEFQKHADTGAFIEGWALYAESLGPDLGLYRDVYSRFGQLAYEMWRAVRLVVDTGIHSRGWSRQQAIDFFLTNSGKTPHDVEVEVDRYIVWPGQALAYKVGELRIRELRRHAETTLGSGFVLREFHDELLGRGALPLDLLEPRMKSWVERKSRGGR
jgi:prolyl oligopeptidase